MFVFHAAYDNLNTNALHIWAESSAAVVHPRRRKAGQVNADSAPTTHAHPFSLSGAQLREALGELAGSLAVEGVKPGMLTQLLPSSPQMPLPAPELILDEPLNEKACMLAPWEVDSAVFDMRLALDFLLALPAEPSQDIRYGSSLRYWIEAAKFALELIAAESFVPSVKETRSADGTDTPVYSACWIVYLNLEDNERLNRLARAMPPVCRAIVPAEKLRLPVEMVRQFLDQVADGFVRQSVAGSVALPPASNSRRSKQPLSEQWLRALVSDDNPSLIGTASDLKKFAVNVASWLLQLNPEEARSPFRTCFRLDPPPEPEEEIESEERQELPWRLGFYLQASDDPSLLVEAEQVWQERTSTLTLLKRKFENPQERLLADLGKAARLFPALEESLKSARPSGLMLDTEQAYTFLAQAAPLLEQSGFGVLLPAWWKKPALRLGVKLKVRPTTKAEPKNSSGLMGLEGIAAYDWQIALGESDISPEEFQKLAQLKVPLVRVRGEWVELKPEEMQAALEFVKRKRSSGQMTLGEAVMVGLGGGEQAEELAGLPVLKVETAGWIKGLVEQLACADKIRPVEQPAAFQGQLRPYQLHGVSWLAFLRRYGLGACLADDMGLGKTIELIALLLHERAQGNTSEAREPVLLICPMSVVGNWHKELGRFSPALSVMVHHGPDRLAGDEFVQAAQQHDLVLTTYALAQRDIEDLSRLRWNSVVLDEAQNIKNTQAKQTQAIMKLKARSNIALTGTPVENRLSELWSIMHFLNPGYLGNASEFRRKFAHPIEKYRDAEKMAALKTLIQPFIMRRVKTDKQIIQDLPDKMEMKVFCNLTREQATLYEAVVKEMLERIEQVDDMERRGLILATMMKLKQICNHPAHFMRDGSALPARSGKLARLEEMLDEALQAGDKALIFTQFAEMGTLLRSHLQQLLGREALFLHGGTQKAQRDQMVQRFQNEQNGAPIFILSLKAGGVGLNLTAANHVFHFDRWWNPAVENQATDRAFRIGQQKNVQVHKFVCVGTLEERIDQMIEQKKELAESIVGSGEEWITELTTDQLRDLFRLSSEAIGD